MLKYYLKIEKYRLVYSYSINFVQIIETKLLRILSVFMALSLKKACAKMVVVQ